MTHKGGALSGRCASTTGVACCCADRGGTNTSRVAHAFDTCVGHGVAHALGSRALGGVGAGAFEASAACGASTAFGIAEPGAITVSGTAVTLSVASAQGRCACTVGVSDTLNARVRVAIAHRRRPAARRSRLGRARDASTACGASAALGIAEPGAITVSGTAVTLSVASTQRRGARTAGISDTLNARVRVAIAHWRRPAARRRRLGRALNASTACGAGAAFGIAENGAVTVGGTAVTLAVASTQRRGARTAGLSDTLNTSVRVAIAHWRHPAASRGRLGRAFDALAIRTTGGRGGVFALALWVRRAPNTRAGRLIANRRCG
jgi:phage tail protein X